MLRKSLILGITAICSGCGLIDSDITNFDLSLPEEEFTVDTAQWGLSGDATFPAIPCTPQADVCADAVAAACDQCVGVCNPATNTCSASVLVALSQQINLVQEKPELETINDQPFIDVTIDSVDYQISENTLNFDSPEIALYVGPLTAMSPDSAEARQVGTIAPVPMGRQLDWTPIQLTSDGEAGLRQFMGDYRSIFNVIVGAWVTIEADAPMPSGRAVARIRVEAHAGL